MTLEYQNPGGFEGPNGLAKMRDWVWAQFKRTEEEFNAGRDAHYLQELHNEPPKPRTGMVVLADGTDWDPGSGAGVYCYYDGSWNKLG
jgi:hypothetical protein